MDAARDDKEALGLVDVAMMLQGLGDYMRTQKDQAIVNQVISYLVVSLAPTGPLVSGSKRAYRTAAR